jgi:hypothetical protein
MGRSRAAPTDAVNLVRSRPSLSLTAQRRSGMERLRAAFNARCMVMVAGKQHQTASFEGRAGPPETTDVVSLTKTLAPSP